MHEPPWDRRSTQELSPGGQCAPTGGALLSQKLGSWLKTSELQKVVEIKINEKREHKSREQTREDYKGGSSGASAWKICSGLDPEGRAGAEAEAEAEKAEPSEGSQGAEVKTPQPTEKILAAPPRRDSSSVLKVSQLLLGAIVSHAGLTVATLRKELGNAGYQVRRKCRRHPGSARKPGVWSTLIRVFGPTNPVSTLEAPAPINHSNVVVAPPVSETGD
ncbi:Testis-specific H1 histone [Myotis davidii]|uniref:Testis-specific H1 histone n=1 Tax=Myotis davidii TaxID=225400 RepID=L5MF52_MYODS|nr:Testis-specific H1 histone [Myotis davidii]